MQERHKNSIMYIEEQNYTTKKYIVPYIAQYHPVTEQQRVLEIGCGTGGNMKPFLDLGCHVTGIDIEQDSINQAIEYYANHPYRERLHLLCEDIYKADDLHDTFDIVFIRDVIEHIPNQERFMGLIKKFLKPTGVVFVAFPPWQNPFGGHQQICNSKFLSHCPWMHLLPKKLYTWMLSLGHNEPVKCLMEIKDTGISLERFLSIVHKERYEILDQALYFINPNYEIKFHLHPRKLVRLLNIPYIRNFYTTCGYYLLKIGE